MFPVAFCPVLLGRDCVRHQVEWWGWGGVPFSPVIIRLLPLSCRCHHCLCCCAYLALLSMNDAEHSLSNLDFRDQLARRLFCVRYVQRPFLLRSHPVADLVVISHSLLPPRSSLSLALPKHCCYRAARCLCVCGRVLCAFFAFGRRVEKFLANVSQRDCLELVDVVRLPPS